MLEKEPIIPLHFWRQHRTQVGSNGKKEPPGRAMHVLVEVGLVGTSVVRIREGLQQQLLSSEALPPASNFALRFRSHASDGNLEQKRALGFIPLKKNHLEIAQIMGKLNPM